MRSKAFASVLCAVTFLAVGACARTDVVGQARPPASFAPSPCGGTGFDYGSGMVAATLPAAVNDVLAKVHRCAEAQAGERRSTFLAEQPYRPHVSLLYGIGGAETEPAQQALHAFVAKPAAASVCVGALQYFDDAVGNKTTVVLDVADASHTLTELHQALAEATGIRPRFAYHPHVTVAYLHAGARFDAAEEAALAATAREAGCWSVASFYLTDRCGRTLATEAFAPMR